MSPSFHFLGLLMCPEISAWTGSRRLGMTFFSHVVIICNMAINHEALESGLLEGDGCQNKD